MTSGGPGGPQPASLAGDTTCLAGHESRIQDIRLRENFVSKAQLGKSYSVFWLIYVFYEPMKSLHINIK